MRAATLDERKTFLITLLGTKNKMFHSSYIREKVQFALDEHASPDLLFSALDSDNQGRYKNLLERSK